MNDRVYLRQLLAPPAHVELDGGALCRWMEPRVRAAMEPDEETMTVSGSVLLSSMVWEAGHLYFSRVSAALEAERASKASEAFSEPEQL